MVKFLKITDHGRDAYAEVHDWGEGNTRLQMPEGDTYSGTPAMVMLSTMVKDYPHEEVGPEEMPWAEEDP